MARRKQEARGGQQAGTAPPAALPTPVIRNGKSDVRGLGWAKQDPRGAKQSKQCKRMGRRRRAAIFGRDMIENSDHCTNGRVISDSDPIINYTAS